MTQHFFYFSHFFLEYAANIGGRDISLAALCHLTTFTRSSPTKLGNVLFLEHALELVMLGFWHEVGWTLLALEDNPRINRHRRQVLDMC